MVSNKFLFSSIRCSEGRIFKKLFKKQKGHFLTKNCSVKMVTMITIQTLVYDEYVSLLQTCKDALIGTRQLLYLSAYQPQVMGDWFYSYNNTGTHWVVAKVVTRQKKVSDYLMQIQDLVLVNLNSDNFISQYTYN